MDSTTQNSSACWSNIVKTQPPPQSITTQNKPAPAAEKLVQSCKSTEGIAVAVVDANAIIQGGHNLANFADKLVTVSEVLAEIRDPVSRHRLNFIPFSIDSREPSPESLNKVIKFARATGDLQTLSDVDLKLIALTYTLQVQMHGTKNLRDAPPPIHTVNVKRLPERDMPGWGANVPNLDEWEALDNDTEDKLNSNSRILPLRDLSANVVPMDNHSENVSVGTQGKPDSENHREVGEHRFTRPGRYLTKKKEINIEGKKMVADGIDASQGQIDDDAGDWMPAVSRSTHRRFLRRKARHEYYEALSEKESQQEQAMDDDNNNVEDSGKQNLQLSGTEGTHAINRISEESEITEKNDNEELSSILNQMRLEEDSLKALQEGKETGISSTTLDSNFYPVEEATSDVGANMIAEGDEVDTIREDVDQLEISSQNNESVDVSYVDDDSSEQSWMLRSLSESSVACVTGDYAMQNVLLQMGLRLVAPGGMQIRQLHRWIMKCHACYTVTAQIGSIFCPKCGNGGTLRKVAVTVGENGIVLAACRPRITLRGTKFSLPLPKGGRDAITKNPILREDQLPQKYRYTKTKKKANKQGDDDFFSSDDIFTHHTDKRAPLQPPIRKALAVFSGRRNPNDNHYSRSKH